MDDLPPRFTISNQGKVASIGPMGDLCAGITFHPPGIAPPAIWSPVLVDEDTYIFQHTNTGYYATVDNGMVLACLPRRSPLSIFGVRQLVRNNDDTYMIRFNFLRVPVWTVGSDGTLGLGPPLANSDTAFTFTKA